MRARASAQVITRVAKQVAEELFTTSITEAEMFYGIQLLATGTKRQKLLAAAEAMFAEDLSGRILGFDTDAIWKATLATCNVSDFENCRIEVVDPGQTS